MRTGRRQAAYYVTGALIALGVGAVPAAAQTRDDQRIQFRAEISEQILREVSRDIGRSVREAVRVVNDPRVHQFIGDTVREAMGTAWAQGRSVGQIGSGNRNFRAEQTARETKTIQLGANGLLDLRNLSGDITISAGSGRDTIIEIVRRSRGRTDEDAKLGLQRVTATVDQRGDRAVVEAQYESSRNAPYSVDVNFVVTTPSGTSVRANSLSGDITVRNIKGDVSVEVTSGDLVVSGASRLSKAHTFSGDVTLTDIETTDALSAGTISGDVELVRVKARRVDIDVTSGDITVKDLASDGASLKTLSGTIEFTSTIARGGRYDLQSHSGDIHFMPSGGAGYDLQVSTFNGDISVEGGVELKTNSTGRSRRSVRGTVGDGSAVVTATTFSGDVVIGRKK